MKILEDWGIKKIRIFYNHMQKSQTKFISTKKLFSSYKIVYMSSTAFMIGFIFTVPVVFIELKFDIFNIEKINIENIILYIVAFLVLALFEFYFLFLLGLYTLTYYIYNFYHIKNEVISDITEKEFLAMLSRTIMELPEKNEENYNVGHHKNRELIIIGILYKVKVIISNLLLKFVANKLLARTSFRMYSPYIAAFGTGVWDAIVFYKTMKHSQYKIMVRYAILYILKNKKDEIMKQVNIKAVLLRYHHYSEYNNNFDFLLKEIYKETSFNYQKESFLEENVKRGCNQKLFLLLFAFKEKMHTKEEAKELKELSNSAQLKEIRMALKHGDTDYLEAFIKGI